MHTASMHVHKLSTRANETTTPLEAKPAEPAERLANQATSTYYVIGHWCGGMRGAVEGQVIHKWPVIQHYSYVRIRVKEGNRGKKKDCGGPHF